MRKASAFCRVMIVLASMGMLFGGVDSCVADLLRDVADSLNDTAYDLDGQPQTVGQWWDGLWNDSSTRSSDRANEVDDWWKDLWD
ncbi:MAG: hypothetical protein JXQ73_19145 [Phycisphaerae bacterium]|nr:hypothetical protein [Phycisphaerae bacterium]